MKKLLILVLICYCTVSFSQAPRSAKISIHSHNDYLKAQPLLDAYKEGVEEIEADVFLLGDSLLVAHSKKEINPASSLAKLYLIPIAAWFKQYDKKVSSDRNYTFSLMIDVKENWPLVYPVLKKEVEKYGDTFNRSKNNLSVQIVISGDRPPENTFNSYPEWLYFDGLTNVTYAKEDLKKVVLISDYFGKYSKWKGVGELPMADQEKLLIVIKQAHQLKKPIRFWGAPDTADCWNQLYKLGVDMINTDRIADCKYYLSNLTK